MQKYTVAWATVTVSGTDQEDDVFELAQDGEPQDHLCITDGVEQLTKNFIRCKLHEAKDDPCQSFPALYKKLR